MAWDPQIYLAFGSERTRPAADLLGRVAVEAPGRAADLGCGPGNSTALLAARWPHAALDGVDSSPQMLEAAHKSGIRAHWIAADLASWAPTERYDVLFSNATLQWLPDHQHLLPRLMEMLAPGGVLAVQVPRNFTEPCHTLIRTVSEGRPWQPKFSGVRDWWNVLTPEAYVDVLEPCSASIDLWETTYVQMLTGEDAVFRWMSGTGLRPFADALDEAERQDFLELYRKAVADAYPQRPSGVTLYPFRRLFFIARAR